MSAPLSSLPWMFAITQAMAGVDAARRETTCAGVLGSRIRRLA